MPDEFDTPDYVSPRALAWAKHLLAIYPRLLTPETLAPHLQALINAENNRVLLLVERALVQEIKE